MLIETMASGGIVYDDFETITEEGEVFYLIWVEQESIDNFFSLDIKEDKSQWNQAAHDLSEGKFTVEQSVDRDEDWDVTYYCSKLKLNKKIARELLSNVRDYTGLDTATLTTILVSIADYQKVYNHEATMQNNGEHCPAYDVLDDNGQSLFLLELW